MRLANKLGDVRVNDYVMIVNLEVRFISFCQVLQNDINFVVNSQGFYDSELYVYENIHIKNGIYTVESEDDDQVVDGLQDYLMYVLDETEVACHILPYII